MGGFQKSFETDVKPHTILIISQYGNIFSQICHIVSGWGGGSGGVGLGLNLKVFCCHEWKP